MDEAMLKSGQYPNIAIEAGSDPAEVMREHGQVIPDGEKYELDTREMLEADIHRAADEMDKFTHGERFINTHKIMRWLDRQAAITRAEVDEMRDCADCSEGMLANMQQQVDSLTAERDHFRKHVNHLMALIADIARKQPYTFDPEAPYMTLDTIGDYLDELHGDVASMRAERDQLSRDLTAEHALVVQFEYDNEKLRDKNSRQRRQLSELQDAIRERNQGVLKRQWKRQVDELTAERDKFADERDCMAGRVIELTAERDQHSRGWAKANMGWAEANAEAEQWRQKCDQLKADLKTANDTINTLRASVAGLKETVEKLKAHETA